MKNSKSTSPFKKKIKVMPTKTIKSKPRNIAATNALKSTNNNNGFIPYREFTLKSTFKSGRLLTVSTAGSLVIMKFNKALN